MTVAWGFPDQSLHVPLPQELTPRPLPAAPDSSQVTQHFGIAKSHRGRRPSHLMSITGPLLSRVRPFTQGALCTGKLVLGLAGLPQKVMESWARHGLQAPMHLLHIPASAPRPPARTSMMSSSWRLDPARRAALQRPGHRRTLLPHEPERPSAPDLSFCKRRPQPRELGNLLSCTLHVSNAANRLLIFWIFCFACWEPCTRAKISTDLTLPPRRWSSPRRCKPGRGEEMDTERRPRS